MGVMAVAPISAGIEGSPSWLPVNKEKILVEVNSAKEKEENYEKNNCKFNI